jgi:hypothetical protein
LKLEQCNEYIHHFIYSFCSFPHNFVEPRRRARLHGAHEGITHGPDVDDGDNARPPVRTLEWQLGLAEPLDDPRGLSAKNHDFFFFFFFFLRGGT